MKFNPGERAIGVGEAPRGICRVCGKEKIGRNRTVCPPPEGERITSCKLLLSCKVGGGWMRWAIFQRDQGKCGECKKTVSRYWSRGELWQADHIIPIADGGTNHPDNIQTLCTACHKVKTAQQAKDAAEGRKDEKFQRWRGEHPPLAMFANGGEV